MNSPRSLKVLVAAAAMTFVAIGGASADANHGHNSPAGSTAIPGAGMGTGMGMGMGQNAMSMPGATGGTHDMMQMMMRRHASMMGGGQMGMGMPGGAMLPGLQADSDGDGTVSATELHDTLLALLGEYDSNADGTLSLEEFATLHAALTRETTVDRFQFLDNDGNGVITSDELDLAAQRMGPAQMAQQRMAQPGGGQDSMMSDPDSMMNNN